MTASIRDYFDKEYLQKIQDSFADLKNITCVITDRSGKPITAISHENQVCDHYILCEKRDEMYESICEENRTVMGPAERKCLKTGLITCAIPFFINEAHIGSWIITGFQVDNYDVNMNISYDLEKSSCKLQNCVQLSVSEYKTIISFLQNFIDATVAEQREVQNIITSTVIPFNAVLNSIDAYIYVYDMDTLEVLLYNKKVYELFGKAIYEKKNFWGSMTSRTFNEISESSIEYYNSRFKRYYKVTSGIIPWEDGKTVCLQYGVDITDMKNYEEKLKTRALFDMSTGTLNKNAFLNELKSIAKKCCAEKSSFAVCFIDIDNLKYTNDNFGHNEGDILISKIAELLKKGLRKGDIIGRFGGDEFVVAMPKCDKQTAEKRISAVWHETIQFGAEGKFPFSFSYGISDSAEYNGTDEEALLKTLIDLSDYRMIEFKKLTGRGRNPN